MRVKGCVVVAPWGNRRWGRASWDEGAAGRPSQRVCLPSSESSEGERLSSQSENQGVKVVCNRSGMTSQPSVLYELPGWPCVANASTAGWPGVDMGPVGPIPFSPGHGHGHTSLRLLEALGDGVRSCRKDWQEQRVALQGEESEVRTEKKRSLKTVRKPKTGD